MSDQPAVLDLTALGRGTGQLVPPCRSCGAPLHRVFVDLGMSPPCEDFLPLERLHAMERFYPLDVRVCDACLLVQLPEYVQADEIFTDYAYFSSYSD